MKASDIAITGIGIRISGADDTDGLHNILVNKTDCIKDLSDDRKKTLGLDSSKKYIHISSLEDIQYFDSSFFGISTGEAQNIDPQQKIALETVCSALDDAGYSHESIRGSKTALNMAVYNNGYSMFNSGSGSSYVNSSHAMPAGRIAYHLDLRGPVSVVDTSCSSSLYAVYQCCRQLEDDEADIAIAGGANILLFIPEVKSVREKSLGIESPDGHTYCFDERAGGTGAGEGCCFVVLKRLADAERDHDHIYAVIKSCSVNHDGGLSNTISAPSPEAQAGLISKAISDSGADIENIRFIEAHGTGTKIGDPIEIEGITSAFSRFTDKKGICAVTGVKSNLGHLNMCAGIIGLIKAAVSLNRNIIYPLADFVSPNPLINFKDSPVYPLKEAEAMNAETDNYAGVSSFGLSGTNVHVILKNYKEKPSDSSAKFRLPFIVSGKTESACDRNRSRLIEYIKKHDELSLEDISYTLCAGRDFYKYIIAVSADSKDELCDALSHAEIMTRKDSVGDIVFLFPYDSVCGGKTDELMRYDVFRDSYTSLSEPDREKLMKIAFQTSFGRLLEYAGIKPSGIWGAGESNAAVAMLMDKNKKHDIVQLMKKYSDAPFNKERFADMLEKTSSKKRVIISAGSGVMADMAKQYCDSFISFDKSFADVLCELVINGVSFEKDYLFRIADAKKVSLPSYSFEKKYCWVAPSYHEALNLSAPAEEETAESDIPKTTAEIITAVFEDVLGEESISPDDDFFDLGGNSLMSMQIINRIEKETSVRIEFDDIYDYPTVDELSGYIDSLKGTAETENKETDELSGDIPVSCQQESMLIIFEQDKQSVSYNIPSIIKITGKFDKETAIKALKKLVERNEVLHTVYERNDDGYYQHILDEYSFEVGFEKTDTEDTDLLIRTRAEKMSGETFDISRDIPIRADILCTGSDTYWLFIQLHHIAADGWSFGIIMQEFMNCYSALKMGTEPVKNQAAPYSIYAVEQKRFLSSADSMKKLAFWREYLANAPETSDYEFIGGNGEKGISDDIRFELSHDTAKHISEYCSENRISAFVYLIAAYSIVFSRFTSMKKFCLGTFSANRTSQRFEKTIGYFANTLPVVFDIDENMTAAEYLSYVQKMVIELFSNQEIPFSRIVSECRRNLNAAGNAFFSNAFVLQDAYNMGLEKNDNEFDTEFVEFSHSNTKFTTIVSLTASENGFIGKFEFDTGIVSKAEAERVIEEYTSLLDAMAGSENKMMSEITDCCSSDNNMLISGSDDDFDF